MADAIDFDTSEVTRLLVDLGKAPVVTVAATRAVIQASSARIKDQMIGDATAILGGGSARHFPQSITYETKMLTTAAEGIIGPDKDRTQGALGNILYFGTSKNSPVLNLIGPLEQEAPNFIAALTLAAEKSLDG